MASEWLYYVRYNAMSRTPTRATDGVRSNSYASVAHAQSSSQRLSGKSSTARHRSQQNHTKDSVIFQHTVECKSLIVKIKISSLFWGEKVERDIPQFYFWCPRQQPPYCNFSMMFDARKLWHLNTVHNNKNNTTSHRVKPNTVCFRMCTSLLYAQMTKPNTHAQKCLLHTLLYNYN